MTKSEYDANMLTFQCARALSARRARSTGNYRVALMLAVATLVVVVLLVATLLRML